MGGWKISCFTGMVGTARGLMEDAGTVGEEGKALEEGRGESLAGEAVAFSATLDAPVYPPERDYERKR